MKKALYFMLLAVEVILGYFAMSLAYTAFGWIICAVTAVVLVALLIPLYLRQKKQKEAGDIKARRKSLCLIVLVMLLPTLVEVVIMAYIIASLSAMY